MKEKSFCWDGFKRCGDVELCPHPFTIATPSYIQCDYLGNQTIQVSVCYCSLHYPLVWNSFRVFGMHPKSSLKLLTLRWDIARTVRKLQNSVSWATLARLTHPFPQNHISYLFKKSSQCNSVSSDTPLMRCIPKSKASVRVLEPKVPTQSSLVLSWKTVL